jgi:hypothetical protein
MSEEFLMPLLEEESPDDILFQQDGVASTFLQGSDGLLKSQVSRQMDWQGQAYHLATSFA